jgi:hypothetical protein
MELPVAMVMAIPVFLFPVAVAWYLNVAGIGAALRHTRTRGNFVRKPPL